MVQIQQLILIKNSGILRYRRTWMKTNNLLGNRYYIITLYFFAHIRIPTPFVQDESAIIKRSAEAWILNANPGGETANHRN